MSPLTTIGILHNQMRLDAHIHLAAQAIQARQQFEVVTPQVRDDDADIEIASGPVLNFIMTPVNLRRGAPQPGDQY
jgi:hypothetical protein